MYGAVLGDMIGQPYEFANIKTTDFPLLGADNRFTDDSVMTCAVAAALMDCLELRLVSDEKIENRLIQKLQEFGRRHIYAGYGGRFHKWLLSEDPKPYNSYGNGSAMRVSPVAWLYRDDLEKALHAAELTARITHDHPEAIKAAQATTAVIWLANAGEKKDDIRTRIDRQYYEVTTDCDEIRPDYTFDVSAQGTMPAALAAFYDGKSYEDVVRLGVSLGGDSDTIGAIAGGMAEAYYGVPHHLKAACRKKLPEDLRGVLSRFDTFVMDRDGCI